MNTYTRAFIAVVVCVLVLFSFKDKLNFSNESTTKSHAFLNELESKGAVEFDFSIFNNPQEKYSLSSFRDKIVIINFWASWCSPCIEEIPSLIKLVEKYNGDVVLVAVSTDTNADDVTSFLKSFPGLKNPNIKIVLDSNSEISKKYMTTRMPESYIFSKNLKFQKKLVGSIDWFSNDAVSFVESIRTLQ
jgi:thiol-disulfide isomerase/thioredoxin